MAGCGPGFRGGVTPIPPHLGLAVVENRVMAIVPAAGFRRLLEGAMMTAESPAAMLLSEDESDRLKVWSWWRRGRLQPRFLYIPIRIYFTLLKSRTAPTQLPGR